MKRRARYRYVDFAAAAQPGFRNHIVTTDEVAALVAQYRAEECYASIFHFSDEVLLYLAENRVNGQPSIAGYDGRVWAPFLPLDIDAAPPVASLDQAVDLARQTYHLLVDRWQAPTAAVHVYFSGAKGLHLLIDTRAFGRVSAAGTLPRVFSRLRLSILRELPDSARSLFDLTIGDTVRLLRLPNTRHRKSGLYKIALTPDELLTAGAEEIRALARAPRPLTRVRAAGLLPTEPVEAAPVLVEQFRRARRAVRRARPPHPYGVGNPPQSPETALCAARQAMWNSHIAPGHRNNVAIRLASAFRLAGYSREQTRQLLFAWNQRQRIDLPAREIDGVVTSAYARPYPYTYGCHDEVIREFCPYVSRLNECEDYRGRHARSAQTGD